MILNRQRAVRVARRPLELFLGRVKKTLKLGEADVSICFVSDTEIARMNEAFRKKKGPTDVLSFPTVHRRTPVRVAQLPKHSRMRKAQAAVFLGDIAISPATARRNAKELGRTLASELQILILHGMLHLLGYDHETDRGQMDRVETRLRRRLGLT
jgi:probable rRNA maturation factor